MQSKNKAGVAPAEAHQAAIASFPPKNTGDLLVVGTAVLSPSDVPSTASNVDLPLLGVGHGEGHELPGEGSADVEDDDPHQSVGLRIGRRVAGCDDQPRGQRRQGVDVDVQGEGRTHRPDDGCRGGLRQLERCRGDPQEVGPPGGARRGPADQSERSGPVEVTRTGHHVDEAGARLRSDRRVEHEPEGQECATVVVRPVHT